MGNTLLGISEVAKTLGVSHFTIRRLINAGEIKAVSIGTRRLVPTSEVERIASQGAGKPKARKQ
jgi:excisionase family DNA binding protein